MFPQFDTKDFGVNDLGLMEEVRKHPGVASGALAVLAGIGIATLLLSQRTGPRRYELLMDRLDPRGWLDATQVRARMHDLEDQARDSVEGLGRDASGRLYRMGRRARGMRHGLAVRARDLAGSARDRFEDWRSDRAPRHHGGGHYGRKARRAAGEATEFARDHAREGSALLAIALVAAAVGAIALEHKRVSGE